MEPVVLLRRTIIIGLNVGLVRLLFLVLLVAFLSLFSKQQTYT
jgi:hypothetical protein